MWRLGGRQRAGSGGEGKGTGGEGGKKWAGEGVSNGGLMGGARERARRRVCPKGRAPIFESGPLDLRPKRGRGGPPHRPPIDAGASRSSAAAAAGLRRPAMRPSTELSDGRGEPPAGWPPPPAHLPGACPPPSPPMQCSPASVRVHEALLQEGGVALAGRAAARGAGGGGGQRAAADARAPSGGVARARDHDFVQPVGGPGGEGGGEEVRARGAGRERGRGRPYRILRRDGRPCGAAPARGRAAISNGMMRGGGSGLAARGI